MAAPWKRGGPGCSCKCTDNPPIVDTGCCGPLIPAHLIAQIPTIHYDDAALVAHTFPGYSTPLDYDGAGFSGAGWYGCGAMPVQYLRGYDPSFDISGTATSVCVGDQTDQIGTCIFFFNCAIRGGGAQFGLSLLHICCPSAGQNHSMRHSVYPCPPNPSQFNPMGIYTTTNGGQVYDNIRDVVVCSPFSAQLFGTTFQDGFQSWTVLPA